MNITENQRFIQQYREPVEGLHAFVLPPLPLDGRSEMLDPISGGQLTAAIVSLTQDKDDLIPLFGEGVHRLYPYLRMNNTDSESIHYVFWRVTQMMGTGHHRRVDHQRVLTTARDNVDAVATSLGEYAKDYGLRPSNIYALIAGTLVISDMRYRKGRPGELSPLHHKSCTHLLRESSRRKTTAVPPVNEVLRATSEYLQAVGRSQFIRDYDARRHVFASLSGIDGETILRNLGSIVEQYNNEVKDPRDIATFPPLLAA